MQKINKCLLGISNQNCKYAVDLVKISPFYKGRFCKETKDILVLTLIDWMCGYFETVVLFLCDL